MIRTGIFMGISAALLLALGGCASNASAQRPRASGACTNDRECSSASARVCVAGTCRACGRDADCGAQGRCVANRCEASVTTQTTTTSDVADTLQVRPLNSGVCFRDVFFAYDDDGLSSDAQATLRRVADCLAHEQGTRYVLIGRADPRGTSEYNLALGERRARSVQTFLAALGIATERLPVSSEGSEGATGIDESGWSRDRRVENNQLGAHGSITNSPPTATTTSSTTTTVTPSGSTTTVVTPPTAPTTTTTITTPRSSQ